MVKAGRNKKRRSGRRKVSRGNKVPKAKVTDHNLRKVWDEKLPAAVNLKRVGLTHDVNGKRPAARRSAREGKPIAAATLAEVTFADVPASDDLDGFRNPRRKAMSEADQRYIAKQLAKHGTEYKKMFMDVETNVMQYTETQLRKMASRFLLLGEHERDVPVPANVQQA